MGFSYVVDSEFIADGHKKILSFILTHSRIKPLFLNKSMCKIKL